MDFSVYSLCSEFNLNGYNIYEKILVNFKNKVKKLGMNFDKISLKMKNDDIDRDISHSC